MAESDYRPAIDIIILSLAVRGVVLGFGLLLGGGDFLNSCICNILDSIIYAAFSDYSSFLFHFGFKSPGYLLGNFILQILDFLIFGQNPISLFHQVLHKILLLLVCCINLLLFKDPIFLCHVELLVFRQSGLLLSDLC